MISALNSGDEILSIEGDEIAQKNRTIIDVTDVQFTWNSADFPVLNIEKFTVDPGERLFVEGPSGCGKSTLISLLAGVSKATAGSVSILGQNLNHMKGAERDAFRADHIGVIFQMFNLLSYLSVIENVTLPCMFSNHRRQKVLETAENPEQEAIRILSRLEMADSAVLERPVTELSVGQQQRVAAARALIGRPELIIADEPTSSLDAGNRESFIKLLFEECDKNKSTLIFASHDSSLAPLFDQTISFAKINRADDNSGSLDREA